MSESQQHPMTDREIEAAAERAYLAYGDAVGWRTASGGSMPDWTLQLPRLQAAWREAARGALGLEAGCAPGEHGP